MKFKVGDRVRIVAEKSSLATIYDIRGNKHRLKYLPNGVIGGGYVWEDHELELVEENPEKSPMAKIDEKRHCIETLMDAFEMHQDANIEFAIESVMRDYFKAVKE